MALLIILFRFVNSVLPFSQVANAGKKSTKYNRSRPDALSSIVNFDHASDGVDPRLHYESRTVGRTLGSCATPSKTDRSVTQCLKMHHNYHGSPLTPRPATLPRAGGIRSSRLSLYQVQTFLFMAAGSRPRRVMILFRPVLRIYAIGDSDKPRRKERKGEKKTKIKSPRYALNGEEM